jgi:hypothetical protein
MIRTALEELRTALGATQIQLIPQVVSAYQLPEPESSLSSQKESGQKALRGNGVKK